MTLANKVTVARILLIPVFVVLIVYHRKTGEDWQRWAALAVFLLAALSDALDGWIARRFNQRSELGAILDPLADKLLMLAALILLSRPQPPHLVQLPLWLVATVLSRDALIVLGLALVHYTCEKTRIRPHLTGKIATVLVMAAVVLALLDTWPSILHWTCILATAATGISGIIYFTDGLRQIAASPRSAASPPSPPS
jgi:CDP-diacylglycerol--glycerol-3-phosphate 3-phosphatidyltransferase